MTEFHVLITGPSQRELNIQVCLLIGNSTALEPSHIRFHSSVLTHPSGKLPLEARLLCNRLFSDTDTNTAVWETGVCFFTKIQSHTHSFLNFHLNFKWPFLTTIEPTSTLPRPPPKWKLNKSRAKPSCYEVQHLEVTWKVPTNSLEELTESSINFLTKVILRVNH